MLRAASFTAATRPTSGNPSSSSCNGRIPRDAPETISKHPLRASALKFRRVWGTEPQTLRDSTRRWHTCLADVIPDEDQALLLHGR